MKLRDDYDDYDVGYGLARSGHRVLVRGRDARSFIEAWRRASPDASAQVARGIEGWFAAARFRRAFDARVSRLGLNLNQWLVLEGARQVIEEQGDATSQQQVAERLEMNEMTLSRVMRGLELRGLVDRRDCFMSPPHRVWVTERGAALLERVREAIAAGEIASRGAAE